jgi:hypothetical protein
MCECCSRRRILDDRTFSRLRWAEEILPELRADGGSGDDVRSETDGGRMPMWRRLSGPR